VHLRNRQRALWGGTHSRGFTLMELGVAVLVFTLIAGVVTLAVAGASVTGASTRLENALSGRLRSLTAVVSSGSYDAVAAGTFVRPSPCDQAAHMSCVTVMGRDFVVSWSVTADADDLSASSEDPAGLRVSASSSMPDGSIVSASRYVSPGNLGGVGRGLLRVRVDGQALASPLYLLKTDGSVAAAALPVAGRAAMRAPATDCTTTAPCRIALDPSGGLLLETVGLHPASALTPVVLSDAATSEVSVVVEPIRTLTVALLAVNPDGRMAWADDAGSVCLYLELEVSGALLSEPACNTADADRVVFSSVSTVHGPAPIPGTSTLDVRTDPSTGPCAAAGQFGWSAAWVPSAVCTGWTWGSFSELRPGVTGFGAPVSGVVLGDATSTYYTATWTSPSDTALGLPAAGWNGDPLWENPRDVPTCAAGGSCVPPALSPESSCPGEHCNHTGGNAPVLVSPALGTYMLPSVDLSGGTSTVVDLAFDDNDGGDSLTVTVVESPIWISSGGSALTPGVVLVAGAAGSAVVSVTADPPASDSAGELVLSVSDGDAEREVAVLFAPDLPERVGLFVLGPVSVRQGASVTSRVLVVDAAGEPEDALAVAFALPTGVTASDPVSGGDGWFTFSFSAPTAPAGTGSFSVTSGAVSVEQPFTVLATSGSVSAVSGPVAQGGNVTVTFTVLDRSGVPHVGAHVWAGLSSASGSWPLGLRFSPRGCVTGAAGTCQVLLLVADTAATGSFTLSAAVNGAASTSSLTVSPSVFSAVSSELSVEQGGTGEFSFTVFDGRGDPAAAVPVSLSSPSMGVTLPASVTTDGSGSATVTVTVSASAVPGAATVLLSAGAGSITKTFEVVSGIASVDVPASSVAVAQRGVTTVTVTARNSLGSPVAARVLTLTPPAGIYAPATVYTLADGTATFTVSAAEDRALGSVSIGVSYQGTSLGSVPITVLPGVGSIEVSGSLTPSAVTSVTVLVKNGVGLPLSGRSVSVRAADSRLSVAPAAVTTDSSGLASFSVTTGPVPAGMYRFVATVDGREIAFEVARP